jgi:hypothetical protein
MRVPHQQPEEERMSSNGAVKAAVKAAEGVTIRIKDQGEVLELDYDGAVCQHPGSLWWGTAVGFRAMQVAAQALSQDDLWDREKLYIVSGHPGPGVKDTIDYITGAASRNRYNVVVAEGCGMQCNSKMKYEWWVSDGEKTANISLRPDFVPREFYELTDRLEVNETVKEITKEDIKAFRIFKVNLSTRIWNFPLEESFSVEVIDRPLQPGELPEAAQSKDYFDLKDVS